MEKSSHPPNLPCKKVFCPFKIIFFTLLQCEDLHVDFDTGLSILSKSYLESTYFQRPALNSFILFKFGALISL